MQSADTIVPYDVLLVKTGELALKGLNRGTFEAILMKNLRHRLWGLGDFKIRKAQSAIYIEPDAAKGGSLPDMAEAGRRVSEVFGISAYSLARVVPKDMDQINQAAVEFLKEELLAAHSFKVEAKRSDKSFPLNSPKICEETGAYLLERYPHLHVDVHQPEALVEVEIRDYGAYIHSRQKPGAGGMPVGSNGHAGLLISGGIDSPVAGYMMAKRGVCLSAFHFASPPYTSERAELKVISLLEQVSRYSGRIELYIIPFTKIQEEIGKSCPEELFTVIMRRFMMRIATALGEQIGCAALITGESVGQVASQTIPALACTNAASGLPVFRPLIGMDKEEIIAISRRIETFDISIQPYEDCCTVFTPRHPRTRPKLDKVIEAEAALDAEELIEDALKGVRRKTI